MRSDYYEVTYFDEHHQQRMTLCSSDWLIPNLWAFFTTKKKYPILTCRSKD